ncbi:MotE family protein [Aureimonas leprariae]|uniref:MotE family protein n=1 Tax=Plantimonas leprariae TaxID=2615207 RepID=A0A7V7TUQ6_9HYPH|nr:MotE family protein [Aureimonas leprariae]KAB0676519.1 MotE family protein [Aureimonas leprariae]
MTLRSARTLFCAAALLAAAALPARAESESAEGAKAPPPPDQTVVRVIGPDGKPAAPDVPTSDVGRYCSAIADPAREARIAAQTKKLKDLETQVNARIDELEQKRADYQSWLKERQAFLDSTSDIMTDIYAKMKPDAAAQQLAAVDRPTAAAVLAKLKPRASGAILSEMPAAVAAELGTLIVAKTGRTPDGATAASGKG